MVNGYVGGVIMIMKKQCERCYKMVRNLRKVKGKYVCYSCWKVMFDGVIIPNTTDIEPLVTNKHIHIHLGEKCCEFSKKRRKDLGMSWSEYVRELIKCDMKNCENDKSR
jgi:hypothetical protein